MAISTVNIKSNSQENNPTRLLLLTSRLFNAMEHFFYPKMQYSPVLLPGKSSSFSKRCPEIAEDRFLSSHKLTESGLGIGWN
jgi:hypothetical protein